MKLGELVVEPQAGGGDGMSPDRRPNRYRLPMSGVSERHPVGVTDCRPDPERGDRARQNGVTLLSPKTSSNHPIEERDLAADLAAARTHRTELPDDGFEDFWRECVDKTSKGSVRRAWRRALRKATSDQLIAGMRRYRQSPRVIAGFVKSPTKWLEDECWLDEPYQPTGTTVQEY